MSLLGFIWNLTGFAEILGISVLRVLSHVPGKYIQCAGPQDKLG